MLEGINPGTHAKEDDSEGEKVDLRPLARPTVFMYLWRHKAFPRGQAHATCSRYLSHHAQISDFDPESSVEEDIGRAEISMFEATRVDILHTFKDLTEKVAADRLRVLDASLVVIMQRKANHIVYDVGYLLVLPIGFVHR